MAKAKKSPGYSGPTSTGLKMPAEGLSGDGWAAHHLSEPLVVPSGPNKKAVTNPANIHSVGKDPPNPPVQRMK